MIRTTRPATVRLALGLAMAVGAVVLSLAATDVALATNSNWPSYHQAGAVCYRTSLTNTWTVMSSIYMNRADGYPRITYGSATGTDPYFTGGSWTVTDANSQQWLYYQVVVGTPRSDGTYYWTYGTWIRALDALGDHTSGLDTQVWDATRGKWVTTGYTGSGSPTDASYANGNMYGGIALGSGKKSVWAHFVWGPIYNTVKNTLAFAQYEAWESMGEMSCG
jgi:hypothetical protein